MGSQDSCLGQQMKTLAYAKALQYWEERVKPPIPSKTLPIGGKHSGAKVGHGAIYDL